MINLSTIFVARTYEIPLNQRGYGWTKKEIDELFDDLNLMGKKCHYLGTIICSKKDETPIDQTTFLPTAQYILEDGQQRLTTFLIIINEIRNRFIKVDGEQSLEARELERLIIFNDGCKKIRIQNKNVILHECLSHFIIGVPATLPSEKTPPIRHIEDAVMHIQNKLSSYETHEALIEIKNKVCNQVQIISVDLSTALVDRYLTFDAINSRGLPLTEFDKIKNFCILICERRGLKVAPDENWYKAIANLEKFGVASRANENSFIADLFSLFHGENVGNNDVHDAFVKKYKPLLEGEAKQTENELIDFINYWIDYSTAWSFIKSKNKDKFPGLVTKEACRWLEAIDNLGLPGVTNKLLSVSLMRYFNSKSNEFEQIARACEVYTFRMHALGRYRVDKNSKSILDLSNQIIRNNIDCKVIINGISNLINQGAKLSDCISNLMSGELNYKNWRSYIYYLLYEYELAHSSVGVKPISWANTDEVKINSIEHILPQEHRDNAWWESHWPKFEQAEKFVHRLGNLVLTNGNSILGRKPINEKLSDTSTYCYNSASATNSEKLISHYTDGSMWKEVNILKRELDIIRFVAKRWSIPSIQDNCDIKVHDIYKDNVPGIDVLAFKFQYTCDDDGQNQIEIY